MKAIQLVDEDLIDFHAFLAGVEVFQDLIDVPVVSALIYSYLTIK